MGERVLEEVGVARHHQVPDHKMMTIMEELLNMVRGFAQAVILAFDRKVEPHLEHCYLESPLISRQLANIHKATTERKGNNPTDPTILGLNTN